MADKTIQYTEEMVGAGHPTKADTLNRALIVDHNTDGTHEKLTVGSDADGDMYYRASSALARLAKGTANHKLFMNAAGTAPEWGESTYINAFTRDCSLTSTPITPFSAIGFTPRFGIFFTTHDYGWCIGLDNGSSHASMTIYGASWNTQLYASTASIRAISNDGGAAQEGYVSAWGTNGPTITWSKTGSPTGTMTILCALFR